jgi:hypothetical protein
MSEPELCHYKIELCSPLLCPAVMVPLSLFPTLPQSLSLLPSLPPSLPLSGQYPSVESAPTLRRNLTLVDYMNSLQNLCLSRQESWWSYEVCFGSSTSQTQELIPADPSTTEVRRFLSGARQYRATTIVTQEGKKVSYAKVKLLPLSVSVSLWSHLRRSSRRSSFSAPLPVISFRMRLL